MDPAFIAKELSGSIGVFKGLLNGITKKQCLWKPQPGKWCLLEIACHLYDEEREDFRKRVSLVLQGPATPFPPIDPHAWVTGEEICGAEL